MRGIYQFKKLRRTQMQYNNSGNINSINNNNNNTIVQLQVTRNNIYVINKICKNNRLYRSYVRYVLHIIGIYM